MSEQKPEQTSGEPGSLSVGPAISQSSDAQNEPVAASAQQVAQDPAQVPVQGPANLEPPAPEQGAAAEMPEADAPRSEAPKADALKPDAAAAHAPKSDAAEAEAPHVPGKVIVMSSRDRAWADHNAGSEPESGESPGMFGKRRVAALAAVVALAVIAGTLGGALATAALTHVAGDNVAIKSASNA